MISSPLKLSYSIKNYSWGKKGSASSLWSLLCDSDKRAIDESTSLAELWVGTHRNGASRILNIPNHPELVTLLNECPSEILGNHLADKFKNKLPYLFKVLSIESALSIQAHPDRELALRLHQLKPELYPDSNHKPEISIAVSAVKLLCGFLSKNEILQNIDSVPEFAEIFREIFAHLSSLSEEEFLRKVVKQILSLDLNLCCQLAKRLYSRIEQKKHLSDFEFEILELRKNFPEGDRGIWFFFVLNQISLLPDQAIFIRPSVLHAYLSGDLVECMANSDNVVRAGLTPKTLDLETLQEMLTYQSQKPEVLDVKTAAQGCDEFAVKLFDRNFSENFQPLSAPELIFCLEGSGRIITGNSEISFVSGEAYLMPSSLQSYQLEFSGGRLYKVILPAEAQVP